MDDLTFLRNLARCGKVVLLADGTALPAPVSVVDDETRAGAAFRIPLVSPEGAESGDRRTFQEGTIDHRDLPLPLLWQWQLDDGHKTAVVIGRIDSIERLPEGLGNARGVFDNGVWGREAERLVRNKMMRGVSGDYTNFDAQVLEKVENDDDRLLDDKISVTQSKLVSATVVYKPAFEGCWIEIVDEDEVYPDGVVEDPPVITASALIAAGSPGLVERLQRLEALELEWQDEHLALTASAVRTRVEQHRLQREREIAVARIRGKQNMVAAWKPLSSAFLSAKAKLQPRDSKGRWIDMGATVRWLEGSQIGGDKSKASGVAGRKSYSHGRVTGYNPKTKRYRIERDVRPDGSGTTAPVMLQGKDLEVIKAVIPDSPEEAQKLSSPDRANAPSREEDEYDGDDAVSEPDDDQPDFDPDEMTPDRERALDDDAAELVRRVSAEIDAISKDDIGDADIGILEERRTRPFTDAELRQVPVDWLPAIVEDHVDPEVRKRAEAVQAERANDSAPDSDDTELSDDMSQMIRDASTEVLTAMLAFLGMKKNLTPDEQREMTLMTQEMSRRWGGNKDTVSDTVSDSPSSSVDEFSKTVSDAGGLMRHDSLPQLEEFLDEIKAGDSAGRSPEQFDAIEEILDENRDNFSDKEWNEIQLAFDKMKRDALDSPGGETIEDLDKPEVERAPIADEPVEDTFAKDMQKINGELADLGIIGMPFTAEPTAIREWLDSILGDQAQQLTPEAIRVLGELGSAINRKLAEES